MKINSLISASLDAADYSTASLAIIAHPRSTVLDRRSVEKLFDFGVNGVIPEPVDVAMIEALGDLILADLEAAP